MAILILVIPNTAMAHSLEYKDGWQRGNSDAINNLSPANPCDSHSDSWCSGYNSGYKAGDIRYQNAVPMIQQAESNNIEMHGNGNRVTVNQGESSQSVTSDGGRFSGDQPICMILGLLIK